MTVTTNIDPSIASLLIDASIESYYALDAHAPAKCNCDPKKVAPPIGYDLVDCWTGYDAVFGPFSQVECFGVVFRSQAAPYTFTLDLALSNYRDIAYSNYNYAGPRVGNPAFAELYDSQPREKDPATKTLRIQNAYDEIPCTPPDIPGLPVYQHVGAAYLIAFYYKVWEDPLALYYAHQALNYQAVLACAFASSGGVCINDGLYVCSDKEILVSLQPDSSTLCSWLLQAQIPSFPGPYPAQPGSESFAVAPNSGP